MAPAELMCESETKSFIVTIAIRMMKVSVHSKILASNVNGPNSIKFTLSLFLIHYSRSQIQSRLILEVILGYLDNFWLQALLF